MSTLQPSMSTLQAAQLRAGGTASVNHRKEKGQGGPTASSLRYESRTAFITGFIKVYLHLERRAPGFWVCSAAGCPPNLRCPGEEAEARISELTARYLLVPGGMLGTVGSQGLSKTSTLGSVPSVLCLPMVLTNHHSSHRKGKSTSNPSSVVHPGPGGPGSPGGPGGPMTPGIPTCPFFPGGPGKPRLPGSPCKEEDRLVTSCNSPMEGEHAHLSKEMTPRS